MNHLQPREIINPDGSGEVIVTRTVESTVSQPTLDSHSVRGYSSTFGGQLVDRDFEYSVETSTRSSGGTFYLDIDFLIDTPTGDMGGDYIFTYTTSDTSTTDTANFFYQNGVYSDSIPGDLTFRASAELERLSGVYDDGQLAKEPTDYSNLGGDFADSDLTFISDSSPFTKHGGEPVPYFAGSGAVEFPDSAFFSGTSARDSTVILVLQWNQSVGQSFPVARMTQGGNTYVEVRNEQGNITVESDFATQTLYEESTYAGGVAVVECRIDTDQNTAAGSLNREVTQAPVGIESATSFASGDAEVAINPENRPIDAKLFDVLTYDEGISVESLDRISKQLSYFYNVDLSDPDTDSVAPGSPKIRNHMFYDGKFDDTYDVLVASSPVSRYDGDEAITSSPVTEDWQFADDGLSVSFNSRGQAAVGTGSSNDVHLLTTDGDLIWTYDGHNGAVEAVENGVETYTYSASRDYTVKKIGPEGVAEWNFDCHSAPVLDLAVFGKLAVYTASEDKTIRRAIDSTGDEDTSGNWPFTGHLDHVTAIAVTKTERIYSGAANGELRVLDNDGGQIYVDTPFEDELSGAPIEDLAIRSKNELYLVSGDWVKKLNGATGAEVWKQDVYGSNSNKTAELDAVAVHPNGYVFVGENLDNLIMVFDDTGSKVEEFPVSGTINDMSIQPGTYEPHWRS